MAILTNALDKLLGYQMRRATAAMMADFVRTLADFDMRPAEITTLLVISENPDCSQSEVGEAIAVKRANMVPIIARLIERDLVARTRVDGRSLALRVTDKGAEEVADVWRRIAEHEARFRDRLSPGDLETVLTALPVLRSAIENGDAL